MFIYFVAQKSRSTILCQISFIIHFIYSVLIFQERVWKITAAAQICHRVAFASRLRLEEQSKCWNQKGVAYTLAKAVMEFWHSARCHVDNVACSGPENCKRNASSGADETRIAKGEGGGFDKVLFVNLVYVSIF